MHCDDFTRTDAERRSRLQAPIMRAGTYRLVCLKPGHAAKGMKATLRVIRRT